VPAPARGCAPASIRRTVRAVPAVAGRVGVAAGRVRAAVGRAAGAAGARATVAGLIGLSAWLWFAVGPASLQRPVIRLVTPIFGGMVAYGQWRIGRDPRLAAGPARFWRILSLAMITYTAGMAVDLLAVVVPMPPGVSLADLGEMALYPIAGAFTIVALVAFPTHVNSGIERVKIGLDVAIVLFGCATFVWYFLASYRWQPSDGLGALSGGLILPALTLVAGFAILRIALAGAHVISRPTMICFFLAAVSEATGVFIGARPNTTAGRFTSGLQIAGLLACVIGVEVQMRWRRREEARAPAWRRPFTVLPYLALSGTVVLLLAAIGDLLNYRAWVVSIGVLALCAAVMLRQFTSLVENSRLLSANRTLAGRLGHQAYHDDLTGLVNRALFARRVGDALARARGSEAIVSVLFIDLDDFKIVNDSLGHQAGDELLAAVAQRLRNAVRKQDILGRLGGDEFAVLVAETAPAAVPAVAQRVITALSQPFRLPDAHVQVAASVGIAIAAGGVGTAAELLRNADVAMYAAKSAEKGGWRVFQPQMLESLLRRHELRAELAQAVHRGELAVYYQPIVDLTTGRVHGAEALVRWPRADGRLDVAAEFLPLAEETGLITEIDQYVLWRACEQGARWQARMPDGARFAMHVNVSARQLLRPEYAVEVEQALHATGMPAASLTLEITETGLARDQDGAVDRLAALNKVGVHLAIDDFGTGYSSLAYLRRMPVDVLKIDKTFTEELRTDTAVAPLARAVIGLATNLGMRTVAEGVESLEQARRLVRLGCRDGQGYLFGQPLTAAALSTILDLQSLTSGTDARLYR
jgi:diguanylate cyclase